MANYPHILNKVFREPWIIEAGYYDAIASQLIAKVSETRERAGVLEDILGIESDGEEALDIEDGIAVINVRGIIGKGLSSMETMCGGCDINNVSQMVDEAIEAGAETIVMNYNTPGGTVTGVPEFGRKIAAVAESGIRVVSYTEDLMASAGYWLGAQGTDIAASPSSRVGSIGVIMGYYTYAERLAAEGIKMESFQAGSLKGAGDPSRDATNEERAYFQGRVDKAMGQFRAAVSHRHLSGETMQGQVFDGDEAQSLGLIDFTADSLAELIDTIRYAG